MLNELKNNMNRTRTENDGVALDTTGNDLLDFFSTGGAMRTRNKESIIQAFNKAYQEDRLLAMKMLFYFRDVREGQGERRVFRILLKHLANENPDVIRNNLSIIQEYGRWDDYYELVDTPLESEVFNFLKTKFFEDLESETPSLLAKWLKSENSSSKETKQLGLITRIYFDMTSKEYRKALSKIRSKINVVEKKMSDNDWSSINYSAVPSRASMIYRKAFYNHDADRYEQFLKDVKEGKETINAGTLYPYDIVNKYLDQTMSYIGSRFYADTKNELSETLEAQWKALPNYIEKEENSIVVCDTSGSMRGLPLAVSISLGIYTAERNKGLFHNHFMTFSRNPKLQELKGDTLFDKVKNLSRAEWQMNTDIQKTFRVILDTAVKNNISQEEMIKKLYIVSDMEFDSAGGSSFNETVFDTIKREYQEAGYELPKLVFWNVNSRNNQFPMSVRDDGVHLVSVCSPSIFKNLMADDFKSPYNLMLDVLLDERYNQVKV